ncbi:outer membrane protein transport protein [Roseovarius sp. Pro17]|uniref:outer membrane protein transport protein n=1 Tax=Roseovarius sp. Pro17 TaxID=3108175 RepID=UPI002D7826F3|nr:outer membrane protein transport protein [Roseovarius sp. Pro17]
MRHVLFTTASTLALLANAGHAGNLDTNQTPIDIIFETGNYAELSYARVAPSVSGRDNLGNPISNVANDFSLLGSGIKFQLTDRLSMALIHDQPYGVDILYGGSPATTLLGGTLADADTNALTMLVRYDVADGIALYGGPRVVRAEGHVRLSGLAYGPLNGYDVKFGADQAVGYVLGAAYERPEIAFRAALTYHSEVELDLPSLETFPGGAPVQTGDTVSKLPQSIKLQVQSGIAKDTLVFGSIRWSEHSVFTLDPPSAAPNLTELDDAWTYEVGVGRRFSDKLSGKLTYTHEDETGNILVSPLAPTKGRQSVALGAEYQLTDTVSLSGGVRYTWIGDSRPETGTPDTARAFFSDNDAVSVGMKIGVTF